MKGNVVIGIAYLVSGFFMVSLHAETLDAPTLVVREYHEHFIGRGKVSARAQSGEQAGVTSYLRANMKEADARKLDRLAKLIVRLGRQHKLPPGLILSVIKVESNFQPWAVSPRGALGLMQLMPETGEWLAKRYGITWDGPAILLDEETNTLLGVKYLAYLRDKYNGDMRMMLSAYNRGPAKVDEEVSAGRSITFEYYRKIRDFVPKFAMGHKHNQETNVD